MKKLKFSKLITTIISSGVFLLPFGEVGRGFAQNVGINNSGAAPATSAGLDVNFSNKGLLIPNINLISLTDVVTISSPATSLLVYNTNAGLSGGLGFYYFDGTTWIKLATGSGGGGSGWLTTGNSGTTAGTNFLGTTDNQAFEIHVFETDAANKGSKRVMRVEPNATSANIIGGFSGNSSTTGVVGAVIAGGGESGSTNIVTDDFGSIGGGKKNQTGNNNGIADLSYQTVAGGYYNTASGHLATVGGGFSNTASANYAVISGGGQSTASGLYSAIGGGLGNIASAQGSIANGIFNTVSGQNSAILGGDGLTLSGYGSIGYNSNNSGSTLDMTVTAPNVALLGSVDLWLANNRNQSSQIRFYEAQNTAAAFPAAGVNYSSFQAGTQSSDINYTLPTTLPTANQVLAATGISGSAITLSWATPSGGGGSGWLTTGNALTGGSSSAPAEFIGSTNNYDWVIKTNNSERARITSAGYVGIGTSGPSSAFHVTKAVTATGGAYSSVAGSEFAQNITATATGQTLSGLRLSNTFSDGGFGQVKYYGLEMTTTMNQSVASGSPYQTAFKNLLSATNSANLAYVFNADMMSSLTGSGLIDNLYGAASQVIRYSSGSLSSNSTVRSVYGAVNNTQYAAGTIVGLTGLVSTGQLGSSSVGDMYGADIQLSVQGSAVNTSTVTRALGVNVILSNASTGNSIITDAYYFKGTGTSGSGTITNLYGLYIDDLPAGGTIRRAIQYNGSSPFVVTGTSQVGIGTLNPSEKLEVCGNAKIAGQIIANSSNLTAGVSCSSDIRYKKNIFTLNNTLEKIMQLRGVTYLWKQDEFPEKNFDNKQQIGFIAQELEKIYPELVYTDANGYKSVYYDKLTPILLEAIKAQQETITALQLNDNKVVADYHDLKIKTAEDYNNLRAEMELLKAELLKIKTEQQTASK